MLESVVRVVVSLAVVLGLFWLVARTGSRKLGGGDRGLLRVRGRQSLSRGSSLAVVEVGTRVLVVGVSDSGVRLLTEMDPAELAPAPARDGDGSFDAVYEAACLENTVTTAPLSRPEPVAGATTTTVVPVGRAVAPRPRGDRAPASSRVRSEAAGRGAHRRSSAGGPLAGSLLAPATWRQAFSTATGRSVRTHDGEAA